MRATTLFISILLIANPIFATITGPPTLNGPVFPVQNQKFGKKRLGEFVHPGLWHTHDDLERIRNGVLAGKEPWKTAYAHFANDTYSSSGYQMKGPFPVISRGAISNYSSFSSDSRAAWQNALMWYITKDQAHYNVSTTILDSWGKNFTNIIGTDASLLVALEGDLFVNAAEIMRWEGNWTEVGAKWQGGSGFSNQLYWLFARQSIINGQANYGMASIKALLNFAIYLDDATMYNYALHLYQNDLCAGLHGLFEEGTGQPSEAGRDQAHVQGGLGWASLAARTVQSQGDDLYSMSDNLILTAAEYVAKYNLGNEVPFNPKYFRCEAVLVNGPWQNQSTINRGIGFTSSNGTTAPVWNHIYYQYVVKRGMEAPWTTKAKQAYDAAVGEYHVTGSDHPSWGDLIFSYDGEGDYKNDNDRTIWGGGRIGLNGIGNIN